MKYYCRKVWRSTDTKDLSDIWMSGFEEDIDVVIKLLHYVLFATNTWLVYTNKLDCITTLDGAVAMSVIMRLRFSEVDVAWSEISEHSFVVSVPILKPCTDLSRVFPLNLSQIAYLVDDTI